MKSPGLCPCWVPFSLLALFAYKFAALYFFFCVPSKSPLAQNLPDPQPPLPLGRDDHPLPWITSLPYTIPYCADEHQDCH